MKKIMLVSFSLFNVLAVNAGDNSKAYEAGKSVGKIVGILLMVLLAVWLIRRSRK